MAAASTSNPTFQCVDFLRLWASKHGFPTLATVRLLCMLPQLVSVSKNGQFCARYVPSTAQGLLWSMRRSRFLSAATTRTSLWATWSSACSSLPDKMNWILRPRSHAKFFIIQADIFGNSGKQFWEIGKNCAVTRKLFSNCQKNSEF